jgi:hypothetical protein
LHCSVFLLPSKAEESVLYLAASSLQVEHQLRLSAESQVLVVFLPLALVLAYSSVPVLQ